jgi:AraC-like DNA-binding protein
MVSLRCKIMVKSIADIHHINFSGIDLGYIDIDGELDETKMKLFNDDLKVIGLEILDEHEAILIEKVKHIIIEMVHYTDELPILTFSDYLSDKLQYDYNYVSNLFSKTKGITIQAFIINQKIERAKELILYNQLNFTKIAFLLNYSSAGHLSYQFKKITGLTCSEFKKIANAKNRKVLNDL